MKSAFLQLRAIAVGDAGAATTRIRDAFAEAGAWITDVHFFGGVQTVLSFEGPADHVRALGSALAGAGAELDDVSQSMLARLDASDESITGTLAVVFRDGDPNQRREIPAVPG